VERRINRVSKALGGQEPDYGPLLMVNVREWPAEDREAFLAGTDEEQVALIERHCGRRPAATGPHGPIRTIIDLPPPPIDPAAAVQAADTIVRET
jgi:hypothetical protein